METEAKIRRLHFVDGLSIGELVRKFNISRNTIRKVLRSKKAGRDYDRGINQPKPKLGAYKDKLEDLLIADSRLAKKERRSAKRYHDELIKCGYKGAYDSIQRFVKDWKFKNSKEGTSDAFIPLSFASGEAYQFDWSDERVELAGVETKVCVAHFKLCYSRKSFVVAYLRQTHEMLFDAHNKAFKFFGGLTVRGIYDNMKAAIDSVLSGKDRKFNIKFMALMDHYLIEPTACTPSAGWEKGQIEKQVQDIRDWFFRPRLKFKSLEELNAYLENRCHEVAKKRQHPDMKDQTIEEVYLKEKPSLRALSAPFPAYKEACCGVTSTCIIKFETNSYSVDCIYANKMVMVRIYADKIEASYNGEQIASHARSFNRYQTFLNPYHYLPLLERKPGALRNGAPFKNWELPKSIIEVKDLLMKRKGGDREAADILLAMNDYGVEEVGVACDLALQDKAVSRDYIINMITRLRDDGKCDQIILPETLLLKEEPTSNCSQYNTLLLYSDKEISNAVK